MGGGYYNDKKNKRETWIQFTCLEIKTKRDFFLYDSLKIRLGILVCPERSHKGITCTAWLDVSLLRSTCIIAGPSLHIYIYIYIYDHHVWSSYMMFIHDYHIWSYMIICMIIIYIYDDHIWSSYIVLHNDRHIWFHIWSSYTIVI